MLNRRYSLRQRLMLPLALLLVAGLSACGNEEDPAAATDTDVVDEGVEDVEDAVEVGIDEQATLVGLEVTVTGNVSEVIDSTAFRIDKDGLGEDQEGAADEGEDVAEDDAEPLDDGTIDDEDTFIDYYDYNYYTDYDDDFGDDAFVEEGVLVLDVRETQVEVGDPVQVTGTIRQFEQTELEDVFGVELDDEVYDPYEGQFVIVADSVSSVPAPGASDAASPMPTEAMQ